MLGGDTHLGHQDAHFLPVANNVGITWEVFLLDLDRKFKFFFLIQGALWKIKENSRPLLRVIKNLKMRGS
jgi:hypothetical protein